MNDRCGPRETAAGFPAATECQTAHRAAQGIGTPHNTTDLSHDAIEYNRFMGAISDDSLNEC